MMKSNLSMYAGIIRRGMVVALAVQVCRGGGCVYEEVRKVFVGVCGQVIVRNESQSSRPGSVKFSYI
jgi:hypothetical protein